MIRNVPEQRAGRAHFNLGIAELPFLGAGHPAAELLGHGLHAVADPQNRNAAIKQAFRRPGTTQLGHRFRPTGKDNPFRVELIKLFIGDIERPDLTVNADLANAACNELGVLGAEIENQDAVVVNVMGHGVLGAK